MICGENFTQVTPLLGITNDKMVVKDLLDLHGRSVSSRKVFCLILVNRVYLFCLVSK